jgi:spore coat protein U-like protein
MMMAALAVSSLSATPALAQSASYTVSATVAASCGALTNGTIPFGTLGIGTDGTLTSGQSFSSGSQNVYCNGVNSTITVGHTAMTTSAAATDAGGFTRTIDFTTSVNFAGSTFGDGTTQALGAKTGTLVASANSLTATAKPYAGSYSGTISVTLSPAT